MDSSRFQLDAGRRTGPGDVECHDSVTDIMRVVEGGATVVTGSNGDRVTHELRPGDVLVIPEGVPHQFTVHLRSVPLLRREGGIVSTAIRIPGPPELLPGGPDAIVDLQTVEGVALIQGEWRYADAGIVESGIRGRRLRPRPW